MRTVRINTSPYKAIGGSSVVVKPTANGNGAVGNNGPAVAGVTESRKFILIKHMTRDQINEKRRKRLCYSYDEPYTSGHVCKQPQMFVMVLNREEDDCTDEEEEMVEQEPMVQEQVQGPEAQPMDVQITLHALSGQNTNNTIRVKGAVNNKPFSILIDSGSTSNFLDPQAAKKLKVRLEDTKPLVVSIADGFKVQSTQLRK